MFSLQKNFNYLIINDVTTCLNMTKQHSVINVIVLSDQL